jgi:DNA replication protein DnaC
MTIQPAEYDVSTREGFLRRAMETTDRRIQPRYRDAIASEGAVTAWCAAFAAPDRGWPGGKNSLLILGRTGVGKTWQAFGAIRLLARRGVTPEWQAVTEPDLYARLRPREGTDSESEFARLADAPLLLLDDLGAAKNSEWTEEVTYRLIGHRYDAMTPTLITTNVEISDLRKNLSERVSSRLHEMCRYVVLKGDDRRRARP